MNQYGEQLENLAKNYYQHHITFEDYRAQRKLVLDEMDAEINGRQEIEAQPAGCEETTQPLSLFRKAASIFKGNE